MDVVVAREMPLGTVPIYLPRRAAVQLDTGERVIALVFVADRTSPHFEPLPDEAAALRVCRSSGRRGTNFDYVLRTEEALQAEAICDRRVSRVMAMARRHPSRTAG